MEQSGPTGADVSNERLYTKNVKGYKLLYAGKPPLTERSVQYG